ncbi:MAG: hypothetical protein FJ308_15215 [Planctomycetes bacterium]|nr:hypothetical protein [Planctomycetota bacterium]
MSTLKDWAQLVRIPNTLTSCADVLAGMCIAGGTAHTFIQHPLAAAVGASASILLYWSGMALNDVFDVEEDRQSNRPGPIVSGRIPWRTARNVGVTLMVLGVIASVIAFACVPPTAWQPFLTPLAAATLLAFSILAYDGPLKKTMLAPAVMGLCRALNMGLGVVIVMSALGTRVETTALWPLLGHGVYVTGFTIAARKESDSEQMRSRLILGWLIAAVGISIFALGSYWYPGRAIGLGIIDETRTLPDSFRYSYAILFGLLSLPLARRAYGSIATLEPRKLGLAIKQAIVTILFFDAVIALHYSGSLPGILICLLVIPSTLLGRFFRST